MISEEELEKNKTTNKNRFSSMLEPEQMPHKRKLETSDEEEIKLKIIKTSKKFLYGNYSRYYGYRKSEGNDPRISIFEQHKELFFKKNVLDIGCNDGSVTIKIANIFPILSIKGIDIDKSLIGKAKKNCKYEFKKSLNPNLLNVTFEDGNYVLNDESMLTKEQPQFDTILCLSVTKWIHLNFGDNGIKMLFKRVFSQLQSKGSFILEAQPFEGYRRRKRLSSVTLKNFREIKLFPENFESYLLSPEIGFSRCYVINQSRGTKGFDRPIQVFVK